VDRAGLYRPRLKLNFAKACFLNKQLASDRFPVQFSPRSPLFWGEQRLPVLADTVAAV